MSKSEMIRVRVEPAVKQEAEAVLDRLGLSPTEAVTLFYRQLAMRRGLPFAVRIPNAATRKTIRDARKAKGLSAPMTVAQMRKRLG